ncbi:hypothetical protein PROAA_1020015 [Candidatus Propionivibrio aalborgensis]|uniref:Uncharacterized protein n=1 Tax=Candidatus Propionivibrio aalborgensis TaxID=1860101 RepID=A0A1A8XH77_9RHOO|nr:hypothetical protein PROAA_1020015 [Candidatus Propionivibrio aalborgensis]
MRSGTRKGTCRHDFCYSIARININRLTIFGWRVRISGSELEGYPSGQRDQTVNLTALPSKVRILLPPPRLPLLAVFVDCAAGKWLRGCSSMVELKPSKLKTRVRFPSPAPYCGWKIGWLQAGCPCSSVVEHSLGKGEAGSSILPMGTRVYASNILTSNVLRYRQWLRQNLNGRSRT